MMFDGGDIQKYSGKKRYPKKRQKGKSEHKGKQII